MDLSPLQLAIVAIAAVAAGFVNAVAGGGTLISFPALTFVGIPSVAANVTNTVALSPGYLGGAYAQRADLGTQKHRLRRLVPAGILGGITGGVLLLHTDDAIFRRLVPFLILLACALLAGQDRIRAWVVAREERVLAKRDPGSAPAGNGPSRDNVGPVGVLVVFAASIYGGYFGAGLGIILLAVLGAILDDDLVRVNALKQCMSFTVNTTAAVFFLFSGKVVWSAAAVMAVGAVIGGTIGGRTASKMNPKVLRTVVIVAGVIIAGVYFAK
jgi:uncharacterized membrane protein YfcA